MTVRSNEGRKRGCDNPRDAFFMELLDLANSGGSSTGRPAGPAKPAVIDPQIKQKAIEWLIALDSPENIYKHWSRFQAWLDERVEHREVYLWVERTWHEAGLLLSQESGVDVKGLMGLRDRWAEIPWKMRRQHLVLWGVPIVIACALIVYLLAPKMQTETELVSDYGERVTTVLADQSIVTLNSNSRLRATLGWLTRDLVLEGGEGIFQVHKEHSRSFLVHARSTTFRATGTEFAVNLRPDGKIVAAVSDGKVVVSSSSVINPQTPQSTEVQVIKAGDQLTVDAMGRLQTEHPGLLAIKRHFLWKEGLVSLDQRPLSEWVAVFNEYSKQKLRIRDSSIAQIPISGIFRDADTDQFVQVLQTAYGIRSTTTSSPDQPGTTIVELRAPIDTRTHK